LTNESTRKRRRIASDLTEAEEELLLDRVKPHLFEEFVENSESTGVCFIAWDERYATSYGHGRHESDVYAEHKRFKIRSFDSNEVHEVEVVYKSTYTDFLLVRVVDFTISLVNNRLVIREAKEAENFVTVGLSFVSNGAHQRSCTPGIIHSLVKNKKSQISGTAKTSHGDSGGGVFSRSDYSLIGISVGCFGLKTAWTILDSNELRKQKKCLSQESLATKIGDMKIQDIDLTLDDFRHVAEMSATHVSNQIIVPTTMIWPYILDAESKLTAEERNIRYFDEL